MFNWFDNDPHVLSLYIQEPFPTYTYTETRTYIPRATKRRNKNGLRSYSRKVGRRLVKTYLPIDVGVERRGSVTYD